MALYVSSSVLSVYEILFHRLFNRSTLGALTPQIAMNTVGPAKGPLQNI